ncbi:MAG TPA: GGDEF domain-containing protein [Candidatus Limnocylindrales bacterium]|nr:GGDEF domain-containing protein [Candidatus Limnocylindrales bacterium]
MSRNTRVLVLIAAMAAASFTVGGLVYVVTDADAAKVNAAAARQTQIRARATELASAVATEQSALDDFVLSESSLMTERFDAAIEREASTSAKLWKLAGDTPEIVVALASFDAASLEWRAKLANPVIAAIRTGNTAVVDDFRHRSVADHDKVDGALTGLETALRIADRDLADRTAASNGLKVLGIAIAFGFLLVAFGVALVVVRRFGQTLERDARQASILNRFTELTTFANADQELAVANLVALGRLVSPDASVTHILNRSLDRAVPEAQTGQAIAEVLPLHALGRCAGVLRGTVYVADDLSDELSVRCPIYPVQSGTLACVPLISGESVGSVHLYWKRPGALPLEFRSNIARITEHAALAIGNRRLLVALHGQANTDARTGLSNNRAFDLALEAALAGRANHESLSVLMIDIDHFKQFNDRHGHPAGDEALKAFAAVLRSCMRDGDVASRYGGEEFAVFLPGIGQDAAKSIGERIRARIEATIISLAPGLTDRITISIGVSSAPEDASDRVTLLRLADEALYRAKESGRNRVVAISGEGGAAATDTDDASPPAPPQLARFPRRASAGRASGPVRE